mgnify:FL=1
MPDDGFGYIPGWFCHTYDNIVPSTSFEENKALFMIGADGKPDQHQLCPTHPEVMRRAVEKVRQAIQANHDPGRRLISIAQNDYHYFCQ